MIVKRPKGKKEVEEKEPEDGGDSILPKEYFVINDPCTIE